MRTLHPIHMTPEERQSRATSETTAAVNAARETIVDAVKSIPTMPTELKMELTNKPNELATAFFSMLKGEKGDKGEKGEKGDDGKTPTALELVGIIKPLIPPPIKGKDGKSVIEGQVIKKVLSQIPLPKDGKDADEEKIIKDVLAQVPKQEDVTGEEVVKRLNPLKNVLDFEVLKNVPDFVQSGELGRGGGGGGGQQLVFRDSTGAQISAHVTAIQFGAGVSASYANGTITITTSASTAVLATTGTIDDSNTAFTFTQLPSELVINGASYQQTGGVITWTWTAATLTATLSSPVGTGGSIFGIK